MVATVDSLRTALERDGFAIIPAFLPTEPCERLGEAIVGECDRLVEAGWKFVGGGRWEGNRNVIPGAAGIAVWDAAVASGLAEAIGAATGQTLAATALGGNLAMPGGRAQNFHIDGAFDTPSWVANIALTATDASNGMTALVPGSHRTAQSYSAFRHGGSERLAVQPRMEPGDVLVRLSTVWHRGMVNLSSRPRPMALISYRAAQDVAVPFAPGPGMPLTICANRYYGKGAVIQELAAVHAPWFYEGLRRWRSPR